MCIFFVSDQTLYVFLNSWSAICHSPKLSATSLKVLLLVDIVLTLLYFVLLSTFFVMSTDENYEYWIYGKKHVKMQGSCCMLCTSCSSMNVMLLFSI